jgi:hypothetical protein
MLAWYILELDNCIGNKGNNGIKDNNKDHLQSSRGRCRLRVTGLSLMLAPLRLPRMHNQYVVHNLYLSYADRL